jgi:hypothetical protein
MANLKITQLPVATSPVASTDVLPVVQGGATKQASIGQLGFLPAGTSAVTTTIQEKLRQTVSPKDFGAAGNGTTNDSAAVKLALESGFIVDGGGLTYAINGTCTPTSIVGLRNANFKQIGNNTAANVNTLNFVNLSNFTVDNVNIDMGANVTTLFSDDGNSGIKVVGTQSGTSTTYVKNFKITRVTVTGNGCGTGVHIRHASNFTVDNCTVRDRIAGSSPDPTNDSQNGFEFINCFNFVVSNCLADNLKTRLGGVDTTQWTRGFLFTEAKRFAAVGCIASFVDQGFDFSGVFNATLGYTGNEQWAISGCVSNYCNTFGFKFANVARDGLVSGCIANNTGTAGFVFSPSAVALADPKYNTQNIDVVGCKVVNVLGNGWAGAGAQGFRIQSNAIYLDYPRAIRLKDCSVIDTQATPTTLFAYTSDSDIPSYPTAGYNKSVANTTQNCTFSDSIPTGYNGLFGPNICEVTGTATQSIATASFTALNWGVDLIDPTALHSTASNNSNIYIKTSGFYEITAQVLFDVNATGNRQIRLYKNGASIDRTTAISMANTAVNTFLTTSGFEYLVSGDYISAFAYQNSGGALNVVSNESYLAVQLVG